MFTYKSRISRLHKVLFACNMRHGNKRILGLSRLPILCVTLVYILFCLSNALVREYPAMMVIVQGTMDENILFPSLHSLAYSFSGPYGSTGLVVPKFSTIHVTICHDKHVTTVVRSTLRHIRRFRRVRLLSFETTERSAEMCYKRALEVSRFKYSHVIITRPDVVWLSGDVARKLQIFRPLESGLQVSGRTPSVEQLQVPFSCWCVDHRCDQGPGEVLLTVPNGQYFLVSRTFVIGTFIIMDHIHATHDENALFMVRCDMLIRNGREE